MASTVIGIDLGTTNSCAAYYCNGKLKVLENSEGDRITPSFLFCMEQKVPIVGKFAKHMAEAKPEYGVSEIKRLLGRRADDTFVQNNLQYFPFALDIESRDDPVVVINHSQNQVLRKTPVELCATILLKIKKDVQAKLNQTIDKAVITVPAYFNVGQRKATLEAATKAGFTVLKLLNEPTAAALSYYLENDAENENYALVYDLGGGTFDVALLKRHASNIDIIGVDGDTHLGGQDFDNLIIDYVCEELIKKYNFNPKTDRRTLRRLQNICEEAKKILSVADETNITLNGFVKNQYTVEIPLTREKFESMAASKFQRTIEIVDNCLNNCNISKTSIKEVILSGGSTRIPKIQSLISAYFDNKTLNKIVHPDECVAEGAALQAAMLSDNPKQKIEDIQITDVISLSLGLRNFVDMMTFLINRNTPIPVQETSTRVTVYDRQTSMSFEVYEGERLNAKHNHFLEKLTIIDITPAPPGQCEVLFTMSIDQNGILKISAKERFRNNVKDLTIVYARGHRSDSEIMNVVRDAEQNKAEDERFRKFACQKEYVLNYCIRTIYNLDEKGLSQTYSSAYNLCKSVKEKADNLDLKDEKKILELKNNLLKECEDIVQNNNFQFMPTVRK